MAWRDLHEEILAEFAERSTFDFRGLHNVEPAHVVRRKRAERGECIRCSIPLHGDRVGKIYCKICAHIDATSTKSRKQRYRSEGRCKCGRDIDRIGSRCSVCHEKHINAKDKAREQASEQGKCSDCSASALRGITTCAKHRDARRARHHVRTAKKLGLKCGHCGKPFDRAKRLKEEERLGIRSRGGARCNACMRAKAATAARTRSTRKSSGKCSECELPPAPRSAKCAKHLAAAAERQKRYRERHGQGLHPATSPQSTPVSP